MNNFWEDWFFAVGVVAVAASVVMGLMILGSLVFG